MRDSSINVKRPTGVDSLMSLGTGVLGYGLGIFTSILIAHAVGPSGKGILTLVTVVVSQVGLVLTLGVDTAIVRHVGRGIYPIRDLSGAVIGIAVVLAPLGIALGLVGLYLLGNDVLPPKVVPWAVASIAMIPIILLSQYLRALLVGVGRVIESGFLIGFSSLMSLGAAGATAAFGLGVPGLLALNVAAWIAGGLATAVMCRKHSLLHGSRLLNLQIQKGLVMYGLKGHVGHLLAGLNFRLDVVIAAAFVSPTQLGIYSIALTTAESLWLFPRIVGAIVAQRAASLPPADSTRLTASILRVESSALLLLSGFWILAAAPIIRFVFGEEFVAAAKPLLILLPGTLAMAIWKTLISDLDGRGYPKYKSYSSLVGVVWTGLGGLMIISRLGIEGAALTTTVAYFAALAMTARVYTRITGTRFRSTLFLRKGDVPILLDSLRAARRFMSSRQLTQTSEKEMTEQPPFPSP